MGLASEILRIATEEARTAGGGAVSMIRLRVGEWSGVEEQSLRFALTALSDGTPLEGCAVEIDRVEPLFRCSSCRETYNGEGYFSSCTHCGAHGGELVQGDELAVVELEVEEP